jgi:hypothetical protein
MYGRWRYCEIEDEECGTPEKRIMIWKQLEAHREAMTDWMRGGQLHPSLK